MTVSVPRPTMITPSIATVSDCTENVHRDPSTLTTIQPALMALPTTHCTLYNYYKYVYYLTYTI